MRPIVDNGPGGPAASVYVHLPFCRERCLYCAFPTVADEPASHEPLIEAILAEARGHADSNPELAPLETLYLGGGTPGLIPAPLLAGLIGGLRQLWAFRDDVEITLEANPANVSAAALAAWAGLGINRLSVGVQSFHDATLTRLGRRHDAALAATALDTVGRAWPHTWSADLLAGWSGQTLGALDDDLRRLLEAAPPHVSVYALTVEEGTPLAALARAGRRVKAPATLEPALDQRCAERLEQAGYERYEVSNFARAGQRSRHNQVYWADRSYLGLGPGAASSMHPYRWVNRADLAGYLEAASSGRSLRAQAERIAPEARLIEVLGVGLRTRDGLDRASFDERFGCGLSAAVVEAGRELVRAGLLEADAVRIRVPASAIARADGVVSDLIARIGGDVQPARALADANAH